MKITLQYFDGCPNWKVADASLRRILQSAGRSDVAIEYELIDSPEMAERVGFHGSPTFLVDGRDALATGEEPIGMMCRVYRTEEGYRGAPSDAQLRSLLTEA